jgi:asparaginyl-tRNA synthetase
MTIIRVENIADFSGKLVTVQGWVYSRTDKGKLVFLLVRDGSGFVQCVAFKGDLPEDIFDRLTRLPQESSVEKCVKTSVHLGFLVDMKSV